VNLGSLVSAGRLTDFWNVLREVDPEGVVREAYQPIRVVVCGSPGAGKRTLAAVLGARDDAPSDAILDVFDMPDDISVALPAADVYLYVASQRSTVAQRGHVQQLLRRPGTVVFVMNVVASSSQSPPDDDREAVAALIGLPTTRVARVVATDPNSVARELGPSLIQAVPHLALPLGRRLPVLRDSAATHLIAETARVNAEFAVVSALPAFVPVFGTLASAGADMIVLTKNQIMLLLKLAVLHRRPINNRLQVLAEIAPVVGAAFLWRTAARALITMLPGPFAVAPRGAVAFVGTYVVGKAGDYYYRWGQRPSPIVLEGFQHDALAQLESLAPVLARIGKRFRL